MPSEIGDLKAKWHKQDKLSGQAGSQRFELRRIPPMVAVRRQLVAPNQLSVQRVEKTMPMCDLTCSLPKVRILSQQCVCCTMRKGEGKVNAMGPDSGNPHVTQVMAAIESSQTNFWGLPGGVLSQSDIRCWGGTFQASQSYRGPRVSSIKYKVSQYLMLH